MTTGTGVQSSAAPARPRRYGEIIRVARGLPTAAAGAATASDRNRRFGLLASSIAGCPVRVAGAPVNMPYTDGNSIFVPFDAAGDHLVLPIVAHSSLLAAGSLDHHAAMRLATANRKARARYVLLETTRILTSGTVVAPRRAEGAIIRLHKGPHSRSMEDSLRRATSGRRTAEAPDAPDWLGTVHPMKLLRRRSPPKTPETSQNHAGPLDDELTSQDDDDDDDRDRGRLEDLFSALTSWNPLARAMQRALGGSHGSQPEGSAGGQLAAHGPRPRTGVPMRCIPGQNDLTTDAPAAVTAASTYPEWDHYERRFRPDWCRVTEFEPGPGDDPDMLDGVNPELRRRLARLSLARERHRRELQGDELDLTSLVENQAARAAGIVDAARVYERALRTAHDLGVIVLLDASGSTAEHGSGSSVFADQQRAAADLTGELEALGNRVATFGFRSRGRESVECLRIKGFNDRFDVAARRRLSGLAPAGFTRLGAAIRHCTEVVTRDSGVANRLIVTIGDSFPYDNGYEHRYARQDARSALTEALGRGVGCAGLVLRSSTDDEVVRDVWESASCRRLDSLAELPDVVDSLLNRALSDAGTAPNAHSAH